MNSAHKLLLLISLAILLFVVGCQKKKPVAVAPQAEAPTVAMPAPAPLPTPSSQSSSSEQPQPSQPQPATTTPSSNAPENIPTAQSATKSKRKPRKIHAAKKTAPTPPNNPNSDQGVAQAPTEGRSAITSNPAPAQNTSTNVSNSIIPPAPERSSSESGGSAQIAVGMNEVEAAHQREMTEELLQSTDANLKSITRTLNADESAMMEQIRSYATQARAANGDGDLIRANNLALKAHLLSDELVKR